MKQVAHRAAQQLEGTDHHKSKNNKIAALKQKIYPWNSIKRDENTNKISDKFLHVKMMNVNLKRVTIDVVAYKNFTIIPYK